MEFYKGFALKIAKDVNDFLINQINSHCGTAIGDDNLLDENKYCHLLDIKEDPKGTSIFRIINHPGIRFVFFGKDDDCHCICITDANIKEGTEILQFEEITDLLFYIGSFFANLKVKKGLEAETLVNFFKENNDKVSFSAQELAPFFEKVYFFKVDSDIARNENLLNLEIARLILDNKSFCSLPYRASTIDLYIDYFNEFEDFNIVSAFLTNQWKYAFLDIYRMIEPFFWKNKLDKLREVLSIEKNDTELRIAVASILRWKPNETDLITTLFKEKKRKKNEKEESEVNQKDDPEIEQKEVCEIQSKEDQEESSREVTYLSQKLVEEIRRMQLPKKAQIKLYDQKELVPDSNIGTIIYAIRNKIVHHQENAEDIENLFTPDVWEKLIVSVLKAVKELHSTVISSYKDIDTQEERERDIETDTELNSTELKAREILNKFNEDKDI